MPDKTKLTIAQIITRLVKMEGYITILERLLSMGEKRRLERSSRTPVVSVKADNPTEPTMVEAVVGSGTNGGTYESRVKFSPPGYHCTCEDWKSTRGRVGPCKHVIALAAIVRDTITVSVDNLDRRLQGILQSTDLGL